LNTPTLQAVIVTGAASGIGRACVRRLLKDGRKVLALDRNHDALTDAFGSGGPKLRLLAGDVARAEDCAAAADAAVTHFDGFDALLHWAGIHSRAYWSELTAAEFNHVLAVNVTGSFLMAQAAARHMAANRRGSIVLCSSTSVLVGAIGGQTGHGGAAYVASKAAIVGLVRSLARALGPSGVRVNGVTPGVTDTPMIANYPPEEREAQAQRCPLGRIGRPEDIVAAGCFLISDDAGYINGETIIVNGGAIFG
jgi:NAD(P)-dependent dehydrogenase (short-subunit alcohol dehydrogenase family)